MSTYLTQRDLEWLKEGHKRRWSLPPRPRSFWRWYGVRHIRAALMAGGAYLAFDPKSPDWGELWHRGWLAHAIWRGWA